MLYVAYFCRACLAGIFVVAIAGKIGRGRFAPFAAAVTRMGILPTSLGPAAAAAALIAELGAVLLLTVNQTAPMGAGIALLLLTGYTWLPVRALMRPGDRVQCNCFGASKAYVGVRHLIRNLLLGVICVVGLITMSAGASDRANSRGIVVAVAAAALVVLTIRYMDELMLAFSGPVRSGSIKPSPDIDRSQHVERVKR